jgi:hypothetical protein
VDSVVLNVTVNSVMNMNVSVNSVVDVGMTVNSDT